MTARNWLDDLLGPAQEACQDCTASRRSSEVSPGIMQVVIEHDPTCPRFRAMAGDQ